MKLKDVRTEEQYSQDSVPPEWDRESGTKGTNRPFSSITNYDVIGSKIGIN